MAENIPLSIVLALITAFSAGLGFFLQKKGQNEIQAEGLSVIKYLLTAVKNRKWLAGFALTVVHIPLYVYALNIGLITITQPLANTSIAFIVLLGMKYLGEKLGKAETVSLILLVAGIFVIAFTPPLPPEDIVRPSTPQIIGGLGVLAIVMVIAYAVCVLLLAAKKRAIGLAFISGLSMGMASILITTLSRMLWNAGLGDFLDFGLDLRIALGIFRNDLVPESMVLYGAALFLLLYFLTVILALRSGKLTLVIPVEMGTSFILPVFVGFFLFLEPALPSLIAGIAACLVGALVLSKVQADMEVKLAAKPGTVAAKPPSSST
ncbi:MAG: hypothetical protein JW839_03115 [Candidatus Lokiarchaeota archaeon]|nr:hypothetical protein [Candidatus Lokiarchaeota archaeon]